MSLSRLSKEEITDLSLINFVNEMLQEAGEQPITFDDITKEIEKYHTFTNEEDKFEKLAQLYTDMNIDGNFVNVGANRWSLRAWYPFDKSDEDLVIEARQRGELDEFEEEFNYDAEEDEFETIEDDLDTFAKTADYDSADDSEDEDTFKKVAVIDDLEDDLDEEDLEDFEEDEEEM
ncbi:DNA-directed RNA polymerase subunit delta [Bacillales bacterium]|uniref:DNA-directed RNA polymerase subunit delta n=1 Tax=Exiguobacterium sp. S22-S28 TaxID=3342768 RepID=UPI0011C98284